MLVLSRVTNVVQQPPTQTRCFLTTQPIKHEGGVTVAVNTTVSTVDTVDGEVPVTGMGSPSVLSVADITDEGIVRI